MGGIFLGYSLWRHILHAFKTKFKAPRSETNASGLYDFRVTERIDAIGHALFKIWLISATLQTAGLISFKK